MNLLKAKQWITTHERLVTPIALLGGFAVDTLTIRNLDLTQQTILLTCYLGIIAGCILFAHALEVKLISGKTIERLKPFFPLVALFTFGSLFSAFLIFYTRDSSVITSWPFLLFLLFAFFGTELFKKYHERLTFQISFFYFGLFSFLVFATPIVVKAMGPAVFVLSSLLSLGAITLFLQLLTWVGRERFFNERKTLVRVITGIFVAMQVLYFTNLIPPMPLALRTIGVYHRVEKAGDRYVLLGEANANPHFSLRTPEVHLQKGEDVSVFSSVFAPTALKTHVVHVWERFDTETSTWVRESSVSFAITGGRDGGYRGYSVKGRPEPGLWSVSVETPQGQRIGTIRFSVVEVVSAPLLVSREE